MNYKFHNAFWFVGFKNIKPLEFVIYIFINIESIDIYNQSKQHLVGYIEIILNPKKTKVLL